MPKGAFGEDMFSGMLMNTLFGNFGNLYRGLETK